MTRQPSTRTAEPRTAAGRSMLHWYSPPENEYDPERERFAKSILAIEAEAAAGTHPRTYSLVGSPRLFLVTDDESGINIGYADKVGGPLTLAINARLSEASATSASDQEAEVD